MFLLAFAGTAVRALEPAASIEIKQHGDAAEMQTRDQLLRLLRTYDVKPWIYRRAVGQAGGVRSRR
jgi:hypothetical protein